MTECLVDLAPLVHWITGPLFGGGALVVGYALGRLWRAGREGALADEVKRWEIVARHKGWHYSIQTLKRTEIENG